jgi:uncharacterized NAD(P)/FAD-binding protein YdhS
MLFVPMCAVPPVAVFQDRATSDPGPRSTGQRSVVIVGGGLSGAGVAIHLLRRADRNLSVVIVEPGPWIGRGVAYGVEDPVFRLNIPAAKMSIDPAEPDDFVAWAGAEATPDAFLPRARYGAYVVERLDQAARASAGTLRVVRGEVERVTRGNVVLDNGQELPADTVVLATGARARPMPSGLPDDPRIIDGWDEPALAGLPRSGRILLVGAGLTALDVIAFLEARRFAGRVTVISRRGILPRAHLSPLTQASPLPAELSSELPHDLRALLKWGRAVARHVQTRGDPWQHAIDAVRPHTADLWRRMSPRDRRRFVRRVRPFWEVMRHRAPAETLAVTDAWRTCGRMEVVAGTVGACEARSDGLEVEMRPAGGGMRRESYDAIVRCMGPAIEQREVETSLMVDLVDSGRAIRDPSGLGIVTDEEGRVVAADGSGDSTLLAIGAVRRASSWETTSVPDISVHARELARLIVP